MMPRPKIPLSQQAQALLEHMKPGEIYMRDEIAAAIGISPIRVGYILKWMKGQKMVTKTPFHGQTCQWQLAADERPLSDDRPCSVATAPVHVRLDGNLSGYDAEIRTRMALCMIARGR